MDDAPLAFLKQHLHEDSDDRDEYIKGLYGAAVQELERAGILDDGSDGFKVIAGEIVRSWYDGTPRISGFQQIVNQGKLAGDANYVL